MLDSRQLDIVAFLALDGVACEECAQAVAEAHGAQLDEYRQGLAQDELLRPLIRYECDEDHTQRVQDMRYEAENGGDPLTFDADDPAAWPAYACDHCGDEIEL